MSRVKDQGRTKDKPRNSQTNNRSSTREIRTPKLKKVLLLRLIDNLKRLTPFLKKLSPFLKQLTLFLKPFTYLF